MEVATRLRAGMTIVHEGKLCKVVDVTHITPGKGNAIVQAKMKDLKTGRNVEYRFRPSEKFEKAHLETREMDYLYQEGDEAWVFMDNQSYEQMTLSTETLGDAKLFILPNTTIQVQLYENQPVGIELPKVVELEVVETEPSLKGATAQAHNKPATLETGLVVQVPPFVNGGDKIRVDTTSGEYLERA